MGGVIKDFVVTVGFLTKVLLRVIRDGIFWVCGMWLLLGW